MAAVNYVFFNKLYPLDDEQYLRTITSNLNVIKKVVANIPCSKALRATILENNSWITAKQNRRHKGDIAM